ncbi:MAG: hypothetical protein ACXWZS_11465 [Gemmatirosa sp.]
MQQTPQSFAFVDDGRTFTCRVEASRHARTDAWWWFVVSTEQHQRHAPFRAEETDSPDDVQARVVAYYDDLLARRAAPAPNRWSRRNVATPAATDAAAPVADAAVTAQTTS